MQTSEVKSKIKNKLQVVWATGSGSFNSYSCHLRISNNIFKWFLDLHYWNIFSVTDCLIDKVSHMTNPNQYHWKYLNILKWIETFNRKPIIFLFDVFIWIERYAHVWWVTNNHPSTSYIFRNVAIAWKLFEFKPWRFFFLSIVTSFGRLQNSITRQSLLIFIIMVKRFK